LFVTGGRKNGAQLHVELQENAPNQHEDSMYASDAGRIW